MDDFDSWDDDDPFAGDIDFDSDFDTPAKKGFLHSVATGFLSGVVEKTIGDTDARVNTLKMALPRTWTRAFSNMQVLSDRTREVLKDIKAESHGAVEDLQYLAGRAAKKLGGKTPNRISDGLMSFSQRDFSDWESTDTNSGEQDIRMEGTDDAEISALLSNEDANSLLERETTENVGARTIEMMAEVGGRSIANLTHINTAMVRSSQLLEQLVDYQRRVQSRNDAMQLNIAARTFLTNAKFYKFMEASQHRSIAELKQITKYSKMSDYEKTSTGDAFKRSIRESIFSTAKESFGGIREFIMERLGKDQRDGTIGALSEITGSVRMALEMSDGMGLNYGDMIGKAAAGIFINNIPRMVKSNKGQEYLEAFKKKFPKQAKWATDAYIRLGDLGHVASYMTGNAEGIANTLSKHYQSGFAMEPETYEEYLGTLENPKEAMNKLEWTIVHNGRKGANKAMETVLENTWSGENSTYSLNKRTLADSFDMAVWSKRDTRSLTEEIPAWLSQIHLSIEKFRTGNDELKASSYDYVRGSFVSHKQKVATALNNVLSASDFGAQADTARNLAGGLDKFGTLSKGAKDALAFRLARDNDKKLGLNPYNYIKFDEEPDNPLDKISAKHAEEIRKMMMTNFGITDDHVKKFFEEGTEYDRGKMAIYMPTEEGRELLANLYEQANSLGNMLPDVSRSVDLYRSTGHYDAMKEAGIIEKSAYGTDQMSTDLMWKTYLRYLKDPSLKKTVPMPADVGPGPTRPFGGALPPQGGPGPGPAPMPPPGLPTNNPLEPVPVKVEKFDDLLETIEKFTSGGKGMMDVLKNFDQNLTKSLQTAASMLDLTPLNTTTGTMTEQLKELLEKATDRNDLLTKILERQPHQPQPTKEEESKIEKAKRTIIDRVKAFSFKDMFNKGVDILLEHEPLILGGALGSLGMLAYHNPQAAALIGGGAAAALAYSKIRSMAKSRGADDSEDLYEEGSDVPILLADKLAKGQYYDATRDFIIRSWKDITGSVRDSVTDTVIGARRLAAKLFTAENKEVFLTGLNKVRDWMVKAWKMVDPFGRAIAFKDKAVKRFFQMDVYKEGAKDPTLLGKSFEGGAYFGRDNEGNPVQLTGWNDIDGPVYDRDGNMLISQEDYDRGLVTSMGVSINKMGSAARKASKYIADLLMKAGKRVLPAAIAAKDKIANAVKADYSPIIESVDRIYYLLLKHWNYQQDFVPFTEPLAEEESVTPEEEEQREEKEKEESEDSTSAKIKKEIKKAVKGKKGDKNNPNPIPAEKEKERLNSAKDKKNQEKEKKNNKMQDALITIAENFGFGKKEGDEEKKPREGIFGLLSAGLGSIASLLGGVSTFFTTTLWTGIAKITQFATMGMSIFPTMLKGILSIGAGIVALIKTRSLSSAADATRDRWGNGGGGGPPDIEPPENNGRRRKKRRRRGGPPPGPNPNPNNGNNNNNKKKKKRKKPPTPPPAPPPPPPPTPPAGNGWGAKAWKGAKLLGLGAGIAMATDLATDTGLIDDGGVIQTVGDGAAVAANGYAAYTLAASAVTALGAEAAIGTAAASAWGGLMTAGTAAGVALAPMILNPYVLTALAVTAAGVGAYLWITRGEGKQIELRMAQYGCPDPSTDLGNKILQAEEMLSPYVVIGNARASLDKSAPIQKVIQMFTSDPTDPQQLGDVFTWFNGRFKPVFLTYMACLDVVKIKSLKEYDESKSPDVYKVAVQTHQALAAINPYPYTIVAKIDPSTPLIGAKTTIIKVNNLLAELKKYLDRKNDAGDERAIETPMGVERLQREKAALEESFKDSKKNYGTDWGSTKRFEAAKNRLAEIERTLNQPGANYKAGSPVAEIFIKDLLPDEKAMDMLTAVRVAAYGNEENIPWRVEAVLKLERYTEQFFNVNENDVKFTGNIADLYNLFKDAFRSGKGDEDDWCKWFRDRFLPVMSNYVRLVNKYRRGRPGVVWKSLSVTARYEIARGLVETKVEGLIWDASVWDVRSSPFPGTRSPARPDKVDRMLKLLGEASTTARLRDPEAEAGKTNASTWAKAISPHETGGGFTAKQANVEDPSKAKTRGDVALGGMYGTSAAAGGASSMYGGGYNTPGTKYGYAALNGDSDTSHLDTSGVTANQGKDAGVSVPKKLAEQMLIREMLAAGFTDPREIAMQLALTNYESGGYTKTAENMKYSDPRRMMSLFKEISSVPQAQKLIAQGEVAIANAVYGGGKGRELGNNQPGDGYAFRGRGFNHLTGRGNYQKYGQLLGIDLVNKPELLSTDPNVMAKVAVEFYKQSKQMQSIKQTGDFGYAARGLNGGNALPGMDKRYSMYLEYLEQLQSGKLKADEESAKGVNAPEAPPGMGTPPTPSAPSTPQGPMMGTTAPPLAAAPGGGYQSGQYGTPNPPGGAAAGGWGAGGGGVGGGGFGPQAPGSSAGLRLKSQEAVAGGPSHAGITRLCQIIQSTVRGFRDFTALNDAYHQGKPGNSKHKSGLALDFALTNGAAGSDQACARLHEIMGQSGMTRNDYMVINEYRVKTKNGTGGHVHFHFMSAQSADKFLAAAGGTQTNGEDTTGGGPVQEKPQQQNRAQPEMPPEQLGMESRSPEQMNKTAGAPVETGPANPGGQQAPAANPQGNAAPQQQQAQRGAQPPAPTPQQESKPQPQAGAGNSPEMAAALQAVAEAMKSSGGDSAKALGAILGVLQSIEQNSRPKGPGMVSA